MYFISGASGQLGQLVTQELSGKVNPKDVTLGSRHTGKLAGFAAKGFKTASFDFNDAAGMEKALKGHDTLLLISGDGPTEERTAQHVAAIGAAKAAGVKRIVYTSFANPSAKSLFSFAKSHEATEAALKASGLAYTRSGIISMRRISAAPSTTPGRRAPWPFPVPRAKSPSSPAPISPRRPRQHYRKSLRQQDP